MRRAPILVGALLAGALLAMFAAPGTASADVIFDQADADELAATLEEAHEAQQVCYGWRIDVDNVGIMESSVGSNFGAGQLIEDAADSGDCDATIEFQANIRWTSESSESEDSASYQVRSVPDGPTTEDLDSLELISEDGLAGDNVDIDVYKAVAALPLLAADAGVADPIEASPAPESEAEAAGGEPTDSPGSDFWRRSGGAILFAAILLLAAGAAVYWAIATRGTARRRPAPVEPGGPVADYMPPEWYDPSTAPGNVRPIPPYEPPQAPRPPDKGAESPPGGAEQRPPTKPDPETRPEE